MNQESETESVEMEPEQQVRYDSVGDTLRNAREQQQISAVDLSDKLKLSTQLIQALESEDFDALPAPTFVRGYLRAIGSELGLDTDALVEAYSNRVPEDELALSSTSTAARQRSSKDPLMVWSTVAIVVVLTVLVVVWSLGFFPGQDKPEPQANQEVEQQQPESESDADQGLPDIQIQLEESDTAATGNSAAVAPSEPVDSESESEPSVTADADDTESEEATQEASSAPTLSTNQVATIHPEAPVGDDTLVLTMTGSSWAEVKDANEYAHVFGTIGPRNSPLRLTGKAPFDLFLGDARQVAITYNDRSFDHSSYIRSNNVAQFRVK